METVPGLGTRHRHQKRDTVCSVSSGNMFHLVASKRARLFLAALPPYPCMAEGSGSATSPPSQHLR